MTRTIEAHLRLSAEDRTAAALNSAARRLREFDRLAREIDRKSRTITRTQEVSDARRRAQQMAGALAVGARVAAPFVGGLAAKAAYTEFAAFDRKLTDIGVTADATREELDAAAIAVRLISQTSAVPIGDTVEGLDSLVASGRKLPEAMAFLPTVVRTARAASAEVVDIARSADAMGESFHIAVGDMEKAFDVATYMGKAGKFEMKDQARYMPSIAPLAATRRLLGIDGLTHVGAALQVIRKNSGTAEEAAASMTDVLGKLDSDETIKRFMKKFDIDLPKALQKAKKEGRNTFDAFIDIAEKAIGGDMEKINQIFADKEARRGLTALIQYRQEYFRLIEAARNAPGTVRGDEAKKIGDAQAAVDRLGNSFKAASASAGRFLDAVGVTTALDAVAVKADTAAVSVNDLTEKVRELGTLEGVVRWAAVGPDADSKTARDFRDRVTTDPNSFYSVRYGASPVPSGGIWDGMGQREQIAAAATAARHAAEARAYPLPDWAPSPGIPAEELDRLHRVGLPQPRPRRSGEVGGITPMPRPRPDPFGLGVMLDDASMSTLDSEIERQRARLHSPHDTGSLILRPRGRGRASSMSVPAPEAYPLPRARPDEGGAAAAETMTGFREELARQQGMAESEAQAFMGRLRAIYGQPVTVNVTISKPPLDTGRSFQNGNFTGAP